jgi:peptide/nickel transport system permease protein
MIGYILNKIFYGFLTLFGVVTVIFFLFNLLGDPSRMLLDQRQDAAQLKTIQQKYGFDKPLLTQYFYYLNDVSPISIHSHLEEAYTSLTNEKFRYQKLFSLGSNTLVLKFPYLRESFQKSGKKVSAVISETLPNTAVLALSAITIAILFGVFLGVLSALYKDTFFDRIVAVISTLGMSVPSFFSAILFAWFFGFVLQDFTGLEMTGSLYEVDDFGEGSFDKGMYFKIPFDALLGRNTRGSYSTRVRPIQRDGGQRLDNFSGNIWWDTRNARYDAFSELTRRMVP